MSELEDMTPLDANVHLKQSLTVWGATVSAQMREGVLAVHHYDDAPRSTEDGKPFLLPVADAVLLRDVLNAATERGFLP